MYGAAAVLNSLGCKTAADIGNGMHERHPSKAMDFVLRIMAKEALESGCDELKQRGWVVKIEASWAKTLLPFIRRGRLEVYLVTRIEVEEG